MGEWREIPALLKLTKADIAVWLATFTLTVVADLTVAVEVGMTLAALLFIRRVADTTSVVRVTGRVIAEGSTEPGVIFADIDPAEVSAARGRIPSLQHGRRFEILEPMAEPTHLHVVGREA